jgi:hypothetical protein
MAVSEYSGIDLGFGSVTAVAGIALVAIGLDGLRRRQSPHMATIAGLTSLLIVVMAGASVIWMYVLPGSDADGFLANGFYAPLGTALLVDKDFRWPPLIAIAVGSVGLMAFAASLSMRRALLLSP